jgi:hypothetical protein
MIFECFVPHAGIGDEMTGVWKSECVPSQLAFSWIYRTISRRLAAQ